MNNIYHKNFCHRILFFVTDAIIQKTINTISNKSEKSDDIIPTPKNVSSSNQNVFQYSANNNTPITPDNKNNSKTNNTSTNSNTPINDNTPTNDKTLTNNTPTPTNSKTATHNNIPKAPHLDYTPDLQKLKPNTFPRPQSDSMILRNVKRFASNFGILKKIFKKLKQCCLMFFNIYHCFFALLNLTKKMIGSY